MWIITNFGFFSVVQKPGDQAAGMLTVRARAHEDLDALRERYLPELTQVVEGAGTDYRFRARAPRRAVARAVQQVVWELDYANFKSSVAKTQGSHRAHVYSEVWTALRSIQGQTSIVASEAASPPAPTTAYGGVVFDGDGKVLLREPTNHFAGYVWTFPKGKHNGRTPEATALLEIREETGYAAEIIRKIPGRFRGQTGITEFFVAKPVGEPCKPDPKETASVRWVYPGEAETLISQTHDPLGRARDLAVLDAAVAVWVGWQNEEVDAGWGEWGGWMSGAPPSKDELISDAQAQLFGMELLEYCDAADRLQPEFATAVPCYVKLIQAAYACGFVCGDFDGHAFLPEYEGLLRAPDRLRSAGFPTVRAFVHTMMRGERHCDVGLGGGYVQDSWRCGALRIIGDRLLDRWAYPNPRDRS